MFCIVGGRAFVCACDVIACICMFTCAQRTHIQKCACMRVNIRLKTKLTDISEKRVSGMS